MPFTPFHWGPSSWVAFLFRRKLHFCAFLIASAIVDIEPLLVLIFRWEYPLHGFFHSFLGGTLVALPLAFLLNASQPLMASWMRPFGLEQTFSVKGLIGACLLGVYFHVFLDAFLYTDIRPFFPLRWNPFYGKVTSAWMYGFCLISFVVGSLLYFTRKDKTWFGNFTAFCIGTVALSIFCLAYYSHQMRATKPDEEMIALWKDNLSQFNHLAEDCNWKRDGEKHEQIYATQECIAIAKKIGIEPGDILGNNESVHVGGLYKGYTYSKKAMTPLRENLDNVPTADIEPYSAVYRKLNDKWYIYKSNPSD